MTSWFPYFVYISVKSSSLVNHCVFPFRPCPGLIYILSMDIPKLSEATGKHARQAIPQIIQCFKPSWFHLVHAVVTFELWSHEFDQILATSLGLACCWGGGITRDEAVAAGDELLESHCTHEMGKKGFRSSKDNIWWALIRNTILVARVFQGLYKFSSLPELQMSSREWGNQV